jgi:hypothetical protein
MDKLKKDTTYYVGRPIKENKGYAQKVVYVGSDFNKHTSTVYSVKAKDFVGGFIGFGVTKRAICISQSEFDKLTN